jgi:hypothetical protein
VPEGGLHDRRECHELDENHDSDPVIVGTKTI